MRFHFSGTCLLASPRLLRGRGHKERSESALALSLPRDCDKEGVVRSRTLGACNLQVSRCHHRFRDCQIFPALVRVGCFLSVEGSFLLLRLRTRSAWQVLYGSWLRWRDLFRPVVFTCALCSGTCWRSGLPSWIIPRCRCHCPGRYGGSLFVDGAEQSSWRGFWFGSPAPILHRCSDASTLSWGACLLVCSRLRGVLGARDVVPHLSSRFAGVVLTLPSIPFRVTVLRVPTMCDDSMVVASVNLQGGTASRFLRL